jgi:hypothetical protein
VPDQPRRGRPRVGGPPAREVPGDDTRGPRRPSPQINLLLGPGQAAQVQRVAARLAMPGAAFYRRAIRNLVLGHMSAPTAAAQIPPPVPPVDGVTDPSGRRSLVVPAEDVEALDRLATAVRAKIGARTVREARNGLIRYAVAHELVIEQAAING